MTETKQQPDVGETSDGYHTFNELYEHRALLYIAWLTSDGCPGNPYLVKDHYPDWDLLGCFIGGRQISYHIPVKHRHLYENCVEDLTENPPEFDGHTSSDVLERITEWIKQ